MSLTNPVSSVQHFQSCAQPIGPKPTRVSCQHLSALAATRLLAPTPYVHPTDCNAMPRRCSPLTRNPVQAHRIRTVMRATNREPGFPFDESDYLRVALLNRAPYGPMKILPASDQSASTYSGVLVFKREAEQTLSPETPVLEVFVAGDTACNIYTQLHGYKSNRPMVHDLMFDLLNRAQEVSRGQWQLLRVAVVALENDIFIGRLFFGDAATGAVMWDCDCRPSDGVYLSLRTGCPFFVARKVWEAAAVPIRMSKVHMIAAHEAGVASAQQQQQGNQGLQQQQAQQQQQQAQAASSSSRSSHAQADPQSGDGGSSGAASSADDYTTLKPDDPEVIKLLKRELAVAVREEDYAAAIRLRDHPYMQLYRRIEAFHHVGRAEEAASLRRELAAMIKRSNAAGNMGPL
ncbi:hypothetical protein Agub_g1479 [Astrephomene gubernaculifera]|uniref:BFN domain-containing protein n=1 Tax=Astrephomene gubernaculifera TaxID=47775 RepID=A0AAD3HHZ5_9CHLO|nr:hypothetical protein Agub_g1479 [Astrephomene gubernaculifera]